MQLSGIESEQVSGANDWQRVVVDVKRTVFDLAEVRSRCDALVKETAGTGRETDEGAWGSQKERECVREVQPLVKEIVQLERLEAYLTWLRRLQQIW